MFRNKEGQVRSGWVIAAALGSFLGIMFVIAIVFMIPAFIMLIPAYGLGDALAQALMDLIFEWFWVLVIAQDIVMIAIAVLAWKKIMKRPLWQMGLCRLRGHGKELGLGLLLGAASIVLVFLVLILSGHAVVSSWTPVFSMDILLYLLVFIVVGFAEEIFSRGFVMSVLRRTRSKPVIVIVSSILFSLLHFDNPGYTLMPLINIALVGALFAYMFLKSGNIWMPIGYHITWNYFQGSVLGMSVSGNESNGLITTEYPLQDLFSGADFGPEGGLLVTVVALLGFLAVWFYYRNKPFDFFALDPAPPDAPAQDPNHIS